MGTKLQNGSSEQIMKTLRWSTYTLDKPVSYLMKSSMDKYKISIHDRKKCYNHKNER